MSLNEDPGGNGNCCRWDTCDLRNGGLFRNCNFFDAGREVIHCPQKEYVVATDIPNDPFNKNSQNMTTRASAKRKITHLATSGRQSPIGKSGLTFWCICLWSLLVSRLLGLLFYHKIENLCIHVTVYGITLYLPYVYVYRSGECRLTPPH